MNKKKSINNPISLFNKVINGDKINGEPLFPGSWKELGVPRAGTIIGGGVRI